MKNKGFTLVEIVLVVSIIGMLASIAIPTFIRARRTAQTTSCMNNLRLISSAKEQCALETGKTAGDPVTEAEIADFFRRGFPSCPAKGIYSVNPVGTDPACTVEGHVCP
ncbi:MAG: competence type IV pilus major pilin ComGC [Kiritimatiellia bacterium]